MASPPASRALLLPLPPLGTLTTRPPPAFPPSAGAGAGDKSVWRGGLRLALVRPDLDREPCVNCGRRDRSCPVELAVRKETGGDCTKVYPTAAIKRRIGFS